MRVLVTGANGFVGSRLVRELAPQHEVWGLARPSSATTARVEWIELDLSRPLDRSALPASVDAVIHLAQSRRYREFPEGAPDVFAVNVASTLELLEYARAAGAHTFILASTGGVYAPSSGRLAESDPISPTDFYPTSKYAAELLTATYEGFFRTIVFRFFFVYGPGQRGMLIPSLLERVRAGETITIEGEDGIRLNPIFIDDALAAFHAALVFPRSEVFNVAGEEVVTLRQLVQLMEEIAGRPAVIESRGTSPQGDLVGDNQKLKEELGVRPAVALHEGLRRLADAMGNDHLP